MSALFQPRARFSRMNHVFEDSPFVVHLVENEFSGGQVTLSHSNGKGLPGPYVMMNRNWIHHTGSGLRLALQSAKTTLQQNIIESDGEAISYDPRSPDTGPGETAPTLDLVNNTIVAPFPIHVVGYQDADSPEPQNVQHVRMHNNLLRSSRDFGVRLYNVSDSLAVRLRKTWKVSHNAYVSQLFTELRTNQNGTVQNFPAQPADLVLPDSSLPYNADPSDPEYLRIAADGSLAKSGVGGSLPNYIGALPPGPTPKEGDWFSQLRSQWMEPTSSPRTTAADVERRAAEWVLRIGGTVKLRFPDDSLRPISASKDLPDGSFVVDTIEVFDNPRVNDAGTRKYLAGLSGLASLQIHHTKISDATLEVLRDSLTLVNLHLEDTAVTDAGIAALGTLPKLRYLVLNQTQVTADGLSALMSHPELRSLNIGSIPASDAAAEVLFSRPRWWSLGFHESWIQPDVVNRLAELPDLTALGIYGDLPVSRLRLLAGLPNLSHLHFTGHQAWSPELSAALAGLPQLDTLGLARVTPSVGWKELADARAWRELHLGYTHLPDELFDRLDQCNSLAVLRLTKTTQSRSRLQRFRAEHPQVEVLSDTSRSRDREVAERLLRLGGITVDVVDQRGRQPVSRWEDLPDTEIRLWSISVNDCPAFDDRVLASLAGLEDLNGLHLFKSGVTDAGLTILDQLPHLSVLRIATEHMTPHGLRVIARQPRIQSLSFPIVTVEQLTQLASLKLKSFGFDDLQREVASDVLEVITHQFPEITHLGVGRLVLDSKTAEILLKLPHLHLLSGQSRMLTADVVSMLARHPTLKELRLYGPNTQPWASLAPLQRIVTVLIGTNRLSQAHVESLAEVPQLGTLTIDRCQFMPDFLVALPKLSHVRRVHFLGCELSDADWERVVSALPNSELLWEGQPRKTPAKSN